jgi:peptidoglycan/LPS O-acetylase OafA/YrhL
MKERHFGALDLYRFIAAFGVAALHWSELAGYDAFAGFGYFVGDFAMFVDFFFILSGFVIGLGYANSVAGIKDIFTFLRRRGARIYPLYFLTLLIFMAPALIGVSQNSEKWTSVSIVEDMLLVKSWPLHSQLPFNYPAWSISVEWAMYLAFPLIILLYRYIGTVALIAMVAVGFGAIEYLLQSGEIQPPVWDENLSPIRALPTFVIGILISRYYQFARIPHALWIGVGLFCIAVLMMSIHANTYVILILFTGSIFLTASGYSDRLKTVFERPMCLALGNASYAMYMLHALFLTVFVERLWPKMSSSQPPLWYGALIASILLPASILTFRIFEKPARDFINGRRFGVRPLRATR